MGLVSFELAKLPFVRFVATYKLVYRLKTFMQGKEKEALLN
jgi:hypothetical protein